MLFRGGAEGHIREYLIKDRNYLDAVIGLPANIFYGTAIPGSFTSSRDAANAGTIFCLLTRAAALRNPENQNTLRPGDIEKIISTYRRRKEEARYSHRATLAEIKANEFNLNIPRYVTTFDEEDAIDLNAVVAELKKIEKNMAPLDASIRAFCQELGIKAPSMIVPKLRFPEFDGQSIKSPCWRSVH